MIRYFSGEKKPHLPSYGEKNLWSKSIWEKNPTILGTTGEMFDLK